MFRKGSYLHILFIEREIFTVFSRIREMFFGDFLFLIDLIAFYLWGFFVDLMMSLETLGI